MGQVEDGEDLREVQLQGLKEGEAIQEFVDRRKKGSGETVAPVESEVHELSEG